MPPSDVPVGFDALDPANRERFLVARRYIAPRVWEFVNREIRALQAEPDIDAVSGILACSDALIDAAKMLLEARQALDVAGGDTDVAALLLGLHHARTEPPLTEPQTKRGRPKPKKTTP